MHTAEMLDSAAFYQMPCHEFREFSIRIKHLALEIVRLYRHIAMTLYAAQHLPKASGSGIRAQAPFAAATERTRQPSR